MITCAGCSCLCTDIVFRNGKIFNACRRGAGIFLNRDANRAKPMVDREEVKFDRAVEKAIEIISSSENLAIYGLDTVSLEAQKIAIEIAEKKRAYIDDNSSYCLGDFIRLILEKKVPTTTLDEVKNNAYVLFYWGTDPYHSLSRHLSRYTYYPRGGKRQRGYEEDRFLIVADVRKSHTAMLAKKNSRFIEVEDDVELVNAFIDTMDGKATKYSEVTARIIKEMKKGGFGVIFGGLGLRYGLKGNYDLFVEMINRMNEFSEVYFMPAGCHPNMRGFNELMFQKTGEINRYSFEYTESKPEFEFSKLLMNDTVDTAVIIGTDPLNSLPFEVARKLNQIDTVVIDPRASLTSKIAKVMIPSSISGVEQGGTMIRVDGVRIDINPLIENDFERTDEGILKTILEGI
jgi:formylmethanofuran dehydrogenase subunit B